MLKLYEKLNRTFSASEKEACLPLVRRLVGINNEAHKNGLLSLENDIYSMNEEGDFFLKTALLLALDTPGDYKAVSWQKDPIKKARKLLKKYYRIL